MAYAAVVSLQQTIDRIINSSIVRSDQISFQQIIKSLYVDVCSLKEALREFNRRRSTINMKRVKTLEGEIIDAVYQFEDVIESHVSSKILSQYEEIHGEEIHTSVFSLDLEEIIKDVHSFIQMVKKIKKGYIHEIYNPSPEEEEDDHVVPSKIDHFGGNEYSKMVGLSDQFMFIKNRLRENFSQSELRIVSLIGTAGIGKTTLAKKLFQDPLIVSHCTRRAFVTIGPKYLLVDVLLDILKKVNPDVDEKMLTEEGEEELLACLKRMVHKSLKDSRYLIVLDDVWNTELWDELISSFPIGENGGGVLLTTRLEEVPRFTRLWSNFKIRFLDGKESWHLLREKVFGEEELSCPDELERAGKKIAENCDGLPLTIVTVADILSKAEKKPDYWNKVAAEKQNAVFVDAYDQMSKVLYPSYDYLDQHLKACFLYMGVFPLNFLIQGSYLFNLWCAEGFIDSTHKLFRAIDSYKAPDTSAYHTTLLWLHAKNVSMLHVESTSSLHSSFWYLCNKEAVKNKFFYALNGHADSLAAEEGITYHRRLCIRNSILFAIKRDVYNSLTSVSTVRSLLCTGPYHHYPVPICLESLRLLRVLDALKLRFYDFPMEVIKLVQLRYLSATFEGKLPASISKLLNLQYLTIRQYLKVIKSDGNSSCLPMEIWKMKQLKYLELFGGNLPEPYEESLLPNLLTLSVNSQCCTKDVFEKMPNLEELMIQMELAPDVVGPLSCFDHISCLQKLKTLRCCVVNPVLETEIIALAPLSNFPLSLTTLTLSGFGYPWEDMSKISSLPNLKILILQCCAFRGPKWEVNNYHEFGKLSTLDIQDTDLEYWTSDQFMCLPAIKFISLTRCYKLKEIPMVFGRHLQKVDIIDCNPLVGYLAHLLQNYRTQCPNYRQFRPSVHSSWDDENIN